MLRNGARCESSELAFLLTYKQKVLIMGQMKKWIKIRTPVEGHTMSPN